MGIKIKRIAIKNFKLFNNLETIDCIDSSLVLLDGPNGFGKTSFYDAIEMLFTGRLRRYSSMSHIIDGRQIIDDNPILCNKALPEESLYIKVEIEVNGDTYFLMRKEGCESLIDNIDLEAFSLPLYELTDFDQEDGTVIHNCGDFFKHLLGIDFYKNFGFLNYIEQEDNTYFLKRKDKNRQSEISHLFNTNEIKNRISKITAVQKKLNEACNATAKSDYENLETKKNEHMAMLSSDIVESDYIQLFECSEIMWDKEELDFSSNQYIEWLGEEGEINKLVFFIQNFESFENKKFNDKLDKLIESEQNLKNLLSFGKFFDRTEELKTKLQNNNEIERFVKGFEKGILSAFEERKINIPIQIKEIAKQYIDYDNYKVQSDLIEEKIKTSSELNILLTNIKESRDKLLENYTKYLNKNEESACPLCGYNWEEKDLLLKNFDTQEKILLELLSKNGNDLEPLIEKFNKDYIETLLKSLNDYLLSNAIEKEFVEQLVRLKVQENRIRELQNDFTSFDIELDSFFNNETKIISSISEQLTSLKEIVAAKKKTFESEGIKSYFSEYFLKYFQEDKEKLLTIDQLKLKKKYINWKYNTYQSNEIQRLTSEYSNKKDLYDNAKKLKSKVDKILKTYKDNLKKYEEKLIKDIEILFHIYSGRIMQDYQNGLGLFIKADTIGIRFIESIKIDEESGNANYNKYDAVFSMSSGQLASLIISFTLALNKRYSKSKLLFIDDPVQTLDELNIAGFVNLLRNEFSNRQIFMSTHEQMMSAYMRYKFEKFNLQTTQINFKEKYIE